MWTNDNNGDLNLHRWKKFSVIFLHGEGLQRAVGALSHQQKTTIRKASLSWFRSHFVPAWRQALQRWLVHSLGGVKVIRTATAPLLSSLTNHVKMVVNQSGLGQTSEVAVQKTVHQLLLGLWRTNGRDTESNVTNRCHLSQPRGGNFILFKCKVKRLCCISPSLPLSVSPVRETGA